MYESLRFMKDIYVWNFTINHFSLIFFFYNNYYHSKFLYKLVNVDHKNPKLWHLCCVTNYISLVGSHPSPACSIQKCIRAVPHIHHMAKTLEMKELFMHSAHVAE